MAIAPQQPQPARDGLATAAHATEFLQISRVTLWRLERNGQLLPVRIGRSLRYRWADLRRLAGEEGGAQ